MRYGHDKTSQRKSRGRFGPVAQVLIELTRNPMTALDEATYLTGRGRPQTSYGFAVVRPITILPLRPWVANKKNAARKPGECQRQGPSL